MGHAADPDTELMLRVKQGDRDAFQELFLKHAGAIARFATRFVGSAARADELAQDVFLQLYRARERYEPRAKFTTYLYRIAHNLCLNEVRKADYKGRVETLDGPAEGEGQARPEPVDPASAARGGEAWVSGLELDQRLRDLLGGLPENQRMALILSRVDELRYQEIGEILDCSEQAVKSLVFRATRSLKAGLQEYLGESN